MRKRPPEIQAKLLELVDKLGPWAVRDLALYMRTLETEPRHARIKEIIIDQGDRELILEPVEHSDVGVNPKRANPMRTCLARVGVAGKTWEIVWRRDLKKLFWAFYGGAHRCYYEIKSADEARYLALRLERGAELLDNYTYGDHTAKDLASRRKRRKSPRTTA